MGNVLQFTLGLATGGFLQNIRGAVAGVGTLTLATDRVFGQFERGAGLHYLSARLAETVGNLYALQKGFKAVGLVGEDVQGVLFQMQKSLGGFNELGQPTKNYFKGLGLEVERLKEMDAPAALEAILKKLGGLNRSEATKASSAIFGRAGAGDALQAARSQKEFSKALADAGPMAAVYQRNAKLFSQIELGLQKTKTRWDGFWLGVAEGSAPAVQAVLGQLNKLKTFEFGQAVGKFLTSLMEGIKSGDLGKFSELLSLALQAGFEKGVKFFSAAMNVAIAGIPDMLRAALASAKGQTSGVVGFGSLLIGQGIDKLADTYKDAPRTELKLREAASAWYERAQKAFDVPQKAMKEAMDATAEGMAKALGEIAKVDLSGPAGSKFREALSRIVLPAPPKEEKREDEELAGGKGKKFRRLAGGDDALSRIGFFSGSGAGFDAGREIARNTSRQITVLEAIHQAIERAPKTIGITGTQFANV